MSQPDQKTAAPLSDELLELAQVALEHAVSSVVPEGGPLIPFLLADDGTDRKLARFPGDLEQGQATARQMARDPRLVRAAVAWDGYLTGPDSRQDAVFVEVGEKGEPTLVFAHAYDPTPGAAAAIGEALFVTRREPLN